MNNKKCILGFSMVSMRFEHASVAWQGVDKLGEVTVAGASFSEIAPPAGKPRERLVPWKKVFWGWSSGWRTFGVQ